MLQLLSVLNPDGQTVGYTYNAVGNCIKMTYPDGKTTTYSYDAVNRLIGANDSDSHITSYSYDANSNLINMTYPNGVKSEYFYDKDNRLIELINKNKTQVVSSYNYTLDAAGNRLKVDEQFVGGFKSGDMKLEESQPLTTKYEYDKLYRLTKASYPFNKAVSYKYDSMGNRISMTTTAGGINSTIGYKYDAADRLLQSGNITYAYDKKGNLIEEREKSKQLVSYSYDGANRLKSVSEFISGKKTPKYLYNFEYDGDGNRIIKTTINGKNVQSTKYILDVNSALPQVLTESSKKNTTYYTYGTDLISMTDPKNGEYYYQNDGLGSVRSLSDSNGIIKNIYMYDAFGQMQNEVSPVDNNFLFTGEQMDDETGLIYLRARYYDPGVGRFLTSDEFVGDKYSTISLNRYTYAYNNPTTYKDPIGNVVEFIPGIVGGVVGGASYYLIDVKLKGETFNSNRFWGSVSGGAVVAYAPVSIVGGIACGGISYIVGAGTQYVSSKVYGGDYDKFSTNEFLYSGLTGGISGGVSKLWKLPNPGRNAKNLKSILVGRETQKELAKQTFDKEIENTIETTRDWWDFSNSEEYTSYSSLRNRPQNNKNTCGG